MSHLKFQYDHEGFNNNRHDHLCDITHFEQLYVELNSLKEVLENHPDLIDYQIIDMLMSVISSERHDNQKQAFFLYRQSAEILIFIVDNVSKSLSGSIISGLQKLVLYCTGKKQRAVSESLGLLQIRLKTNDGDLKFNDHVFDVSFEHLIQQFDGVDLNSFRWHGRTLRFSCKNQMIGCLKFARKKKDHKNLAIEIAWLRHLKGHSDGIQDTGHIPDPLGIKNYSLFNIVNIPCHIIEKACGISLESAVAIGFTTVPEYYYYPNEAPVLTYDKDLIRTLFKKSAFLLGTLVSKGIIHTALIPLFHNRVQQARRQDNGFYLWEHGGRLDQWLASCRFPNFSVSGLRDFEHLTRTTKSSQIRHYIGEHLLGFILVIGSFFRNMAPDQKGYDSNGDPLDVRYLFDIHFFSLLLNDVAAAYWKAVTGKDFKYFKLMFHHDFIQSVINVMGIDRDMEETLRVQDQNNMDEKRFYQFLSSRGLPDKDATRLKKGEKDIVCSSGPHLGGFNQQISIPGLIEKLFCFSSLCTSDRYMLENGLKSDVERSLLTPIDVEIPLFNRPEPMNKDS